MEQRPNTPATTWKVPTTTSDYDARWAAMAASGQNPHGEADFLCRYSPASVLDGGCGTGRVAIELHRRGIETVGVDADPQMLEAARAKEPAIPWILGDLATVDLGRSFDLIALPGNVMIFVQPGSEAAVIENLARHLAPGGRLVAGFQLGRPGTIDLRTYDSLCTAAGLECEARFATWDGLPWDDGTYAVSVARRPAPPATATT